LPHAVCSYSLSFLSALAHSRLPVAGVGLVRQEFVVANHIGIHPNAVLFPDRISEEAKQIIHEKAKNDRSPQDFFIRKLSEGVGSIAAAFYPRPIIVRLGDFKSNGKIPCGAFRGPKPHAVLTLSYLQQNTDA